MEPSRTIYFTSFTFSYLNRARVLVQSLRRFNPQCCIIGLICDAPPEHVSVTDALAEFDGVVYADELEIANFKQWVFKHDIVEISTAIKGVFLDRIAVNGFMGNSIDKVIYLDPDIAVFSSMHFVEELLEDSSIILTPHLVDPEESVQGILDNEISALAHGAFNLGFIAVRNDHEGQRFARWWCDRLQRHCYDDVPNGLFTDQKWCNLVPCLFDRTMVLRDPGANVASWNLSRRTLSINQDGSALVNGKLLRFFHFTKLGPIGDSMTLRYMKGSFSVLELWRWYQEQVARKSVAEIATDYWYYGRYENGVPIRREHRLLYRSRADLRETFPDPFAVPADGGYHGWTEREWCSNG